MTTHDPNEIRNGIEAKCDIQESKNNSSNKERKEYQNQKRGTPASRERTITRTPKQYKKMPNTLDVRVQGRQKRPNECVCKEEGARA